MEEVLDSVRCTFRAKDKDEGENQEKLEMLEKESAFLKIGVLSLRRHTHTVMCEQGGPWTRSEITRYFLLCVRERLMKLT